MPNFLKDQLFSLIKSMTKAEKRNFKLYVNRLQSGTDTKFMQLFEALDKMETYDEAVLLRRLPDVKKRHLANLKRHLYQQILISLRLIYIKKNIDIQIREQLDFARILYGKGMYMQSLRLLDRIKRIAVEHHQDILHLEILEFEKFIEARHITRSRLVANKMEDLLDASARRSFITYTTNQLSNLNIQVQGWYIQHGHVRNEAGKEAVQSYFEQHLPTDSPPHELTFFEKANLYQSYVWYYYILLDLPAACRYARHWVDLFDENPQMQEKDPDLYMRGLYYLLTFLFFLRSGSEFRHYLQQFELFVAGGEASWNPNSQMIAFVYLNLSRLNRHFLDGTYTKGLQLAPALLAAIPRYESHTDPHRILLLHYKIAYLHFGCGRFADALRHLNRVVLINEEHLREDLDLNARLLHLICNCETGDYDLVESYLLPAARRAVSRARDTSEIQKAALRFIKKLIRTPQQDQLPLFLDFKQELAALTTNPYEQKELAYLDLASWVESHLRACTIEALQIVNASR